MATEGSPGLKPGDGLTIKPDQKVTMFQVNVFRSSAFAGGATLLVLMALLLAGCGRAGSDIAYTRNDHDDRALGFTVESTEENSHRHTVWIWFVNLSSPPAGGVLYTSATNFGHTHTIFLSERQLADMNNGNTEIVISSIVQDHFHTWVLSRRTASYFQGAGSHQRMVSGE